MKLAACVMARDEEEAIAEWILYHHALGFDTLLVVDHLSRDGTAAEALAAGRIADVRIFRVDLETPGLQAMLYAQVCERWRDEFDWIAFFDADEFLVGPSGAMIPDLLAARAEAAAVVVPWLMFGSSGHVEKPAGLAIEAYRRRAPHDFLPNHHVKSIVRPARVTSCINAHCFAVDGATLLPGGRAARWSDPGKLDHHPVDEPWRLHHYFTRSRRHWEDRLRRGQISRLKRTLADFDAHDRNEIEDDSACRLAPAVHRLLDRMRE